MPSAARPRLYPKPPISIPGAGVRSEVANPARRSGAPAAKPESGSNRNQISFAVISRLPEINHGRRPAEAARLPCIVRDPDDEPQPADDLRGRLQAEPDHQAEHE